MLTTVAAAVYSLSLNSPAGARSIGSLKVSEAGLGTLNLALDKAEDPDAASALRASVEAGCNFVDTAEAYGFGTSEKLTAWAAEQAGLRIGTGEGELVVATKFAPVPWRPDANSVVDACKASAERLGVDSIPLYQIHFPDIIQPFKAFGLEKRKDELYWDGLAQCYEQGLAANVCVSQSAGTLERPLCLDCALPLCALLFTHDAMTRWLSDRSLAPFWCWCQQW